MLHPSYTELIAKANEGLEPGDEPVVASRYSIVCAAAKRARQLVNEANKNNEDILAEGVAKPLSDAVKELQDGKIYIMTEEEYTEAHEKMESEIDDHVAAKVAAKLEAMKEAAQAKKDDDEVVDFDDDEDDDDDSDDSLNDEDDEDDEEDE
jgi:DNA-directed RNA polymerase subunit omega